MPGERLAKTQFTRPGKCLENRRTRLRRSDGLWQDIESSAVGATADVQVTGYGVGANVKLNGFDVVGYYYNGEGLGRSLQFVDGTRAERAFPRASLSLRVINEFRAETQPQLPKTATEKSHR